jgi:hypothetical protein
MTVVYWICGILFLTLAGSSAFFMALHVSTGEHVPRERSVALYRWAVVVGLGTFNLWIFKRVIEALIMIMR